MIIVVEEKQQIQPSKTPGYNNCVSIQLYMLKAVFGNLISNPISWECVLETFQKLSHVQEENVANEINNDSMRRIESESRK